MTSPGLKQPTRQEFPRHSQTLHNFKIDPYVVNQIALNLFGDRYIIIYDNTIQFHNHCYHVRTIESEGHPYKGYYYLQDANTDLAMWDDVLFAPPGYYGVIFEPETGKIIDCEPQR